MRRSPRRPPGAARPAANSAASRSSNAFENAGHFLIPRVVELDVLVARRYVSHDDAQSAATKCRVQRSAQLRQRRHSQTLLTERTRDRDEVVIPRCAEA